MTFIFMLDTKIIINKYNYILNIKINEEILFLWAATEKLVLNFKIILMNLKLEWYKEHKSFMDY